MRNLTRSIIICAFFAFVGCGEPTGGTITVGRFSLNKSSIALVKGETELLSATIYPDNVSSGGVRWSSNAEDIAAVDPETGEVTAVAEGEAVVTATAANGGKTASCKVAVTPELNILFIGNSFTEDAVQHLPGIIAAAGIEKVRMVHLYFGGRTIAEHAAGYSTKDDYRCFRSDPGTSAWTLDGQTRKARNVVKERQWNIVSIQEHTGRPVAWEWSDENRLTIDGWLANMGADQAAAPRFVYIMSQAYGDPEIVSYGQSRVLTDNFSSQADMFAAIAARGRKVERDTAVEVIIPTATALQNLRSSPLNTAYDLTRDGYHMDLGLARYAAACTVFQSIVIPSLGGATLEENSFRFAASSTENTKYSTPVTDANVPTAIEAVGSAVSRPFEITAMSE